MDEAPAAQEIAHGPAGALAGVELVFRERLREDRLSASEIEVLSSHLTDLVSELLQLTYENNNPE